MRFISQYRLYEGITAQKEITKPTWNGEHEIKQKGLRAVPFRWLDVDERERQVALKHWPNMAGLTEGENPVYRLSCFDSLHAQEVHGWTDAERKIVEDALIGGPGNGSDYILVEEVRTEAPYRLYDEHRKTAGKRTLEHAIKDITDAYESAGFDVDQAVQYERENGNSAVVVAALEGLVAESALEEVIQA